MVHHPIDMNLIILDLDGTVRRCREHQGPCHNQSGQWEIIPSTIDVLRMYDWSKVGIGFATNQAQIGLGLYSEGGVLHEIEVTIRALFPDWPMTTVLDGPIGPGLHQMHQERRRFPERGPVYRYAPAKPDASDARRKPSPWMILDIVNSYHERLDRTLYIGDSPEDLESASRAQVNFLWAHEFFGREYQQPNIVKSHNFTI